MFKTHSARGFIICFVVTVLSLAIYVMGGFDTWELKTVDLRFHVRGNRPINNDIVIVSIDEPSIAKLGRWPWPRKIHGQLIDKLSLAKPKVIAFDVLFTERDKKNSDLQLAQAAARSGKVVSSFFFQNMKNDTIVGVDPLYPYQELLDVSEQGFVNLEPDGDGVTRKAPLYLLGEQKEGKKGFLVYPSLAVSILGMVEGRNFEELLPELPVSLELDTGLVENKLFINYAFSQNEKGYTYPTYEFADVLQDKIDLKKAFANKIVFVGGFAIALFDLKAIPFTSIHPGVLVHANVLDNLIAKNYLRQTPIEFTLLYVLFLGLLLAYFLPRLSIWAKLGFFLATVGGGLGFSQWLFSADNMVIPVIPPLFTGFGSYFGVLFYRLIIEEREKRKIKGSFKQYLSPKIIDIMTKDPSKLKLGGEEREVSIFFLDIAGFTTMSEALKPTQLVEVMNQCLTRFSDIILKNEGLINKYIGDCIMAFWNSPVDQPRHASLACLAALDCIAALPGLNRRFQEKGLPNIDCRIGVNTGVVVVGNMGSNEKFDYTVMGDPVNLASRLEGANKQYHTHIMISEATFEKARGEIEARDLDLIRVKGKKEPKKVFEVLCRKGNMPDELSVGRKKYHNGLALYRQRNFDDAIHVFQEVFDYLPNDHVTRVYLERSRTFVNRPPPAAWDGVFEMKTK